MICVCNWRTAEKEREKKSTERWVTKGKTERVTLAGESELKNKKTKKPLERVLIS